MPNLVGTRQSVTLTGAIAQREPFKNPASAFGLPQMFTATLNAPGTNQNHWGLLVGIAGGVVPERCL